MLKVSRLGLPFASVMSRADSSFLRLDWHSSAIAINQDSLVARPFLVSKSESDGQVWARALSGGDVAVALLNLGDTAQQLAFDLQDLCEGCAQGATTTDVWSGKTTAINASTLSPQYRTSVPPHATVLLRLKPTAAAGP